MTLTVYGASDDLIEVDGDLNEEFGYHNDGDDDGDLLAFSDGTVLRITYTEVGMWRIALVARGSAELSIAQGEKVPYVEPEPPAAEPQRESLWPGVAALAIIVAGILAGIWMVTQ